MAESTLGYSLQKQVNDLNSKSIKFKNYKFENLAQYTNQGYYLQISNIREKAGLPNNAQLVSASLNGWSSVGQYPNVQLIGNDDVYVFYPPNSTITSSSYVTVRFAYM